MKNFLLLLIFAFLGAILYHFAMLRQARQEAPPAPEVVQTPNPRPRPSTPMPAGSSLQGGGFRTGGGLQSGGLQSGGLNQGRAPVDNRQRR
jgi:hypothetical protein